jgi:type IX secretion system PorP/SprF family membrane protein
MSILAVTEVKAQDIHFSQFYNSPLTLNPAETGFFRGGIYRAAANYRNQWNWLPFPYTTYSASFDVKALEQFMQNRDVLGVGIYAYSDKAGEGNISSSGGALSLAFHKDFYQGMNLIGLGGQVAMKQIGFDPNVLVFGDQIENGTATTLETFATTNVSYVDVNVGAFWNFIPNDALNINTGVAYMHANAPQISFLDDGINWTLNNLIVVYSYWGISMHEKFDLLPSLIYMNQQANIEMFLGSAVRYNSTDEMGFRAGMWYRNSRISDAVTLLVGMDIGTLKAAMSYDVNVSTLSSASNGNGAFEFSIIYETGKSKRSGGYIKCPRI